MIVKWTIFKWPQAESTIRPVVGLGCLSVGMLGVTLSFESGVGWSFGAGIGLGLTLGSMLGLGLYSDELGGILVSMLGLMLVGGLGFGLGSVLAGGLCGSVLVFGLSLVLGFGLIAYYRMQFNRIEQKYIVNPISRVLLTLNRQIPFRFERFLKHCADAFLLTRAGNNYRFMHDLLRDHFALRELTPHLKDSDPNVRMLTVQRLALLGETAQEALEDATHDEDERVREAARAALEKISAELEDDALKPDETVDSSVL